MILILQVMMKIIYTLEFIYTHTKHDSSHTTDTTLQKNYSTLKKPSFNTPQEITSAINVQTNSQSLTHCPQVIPFYDTSFFKYKNYFQGFFLPDDYSLDLKTLQQQQSQDTVLKTVYSWLLNNEKPESQKTTYYWYSLSTCILQKIFTTFYR